MGCRGTMRHDDICTLWYSLPRFNTGLAARQIERPVTEGGLPGGPENLQPVELCARVLEVGEIWRLGEDAAHSLRILHWTMEAIPVCSIEFRLEGDVVVARDHHAVLVGQRRQPALEGLHLPSLASLGKISRVQEHVTLREARDLAVSPMCVRNAHEAHDPGGQGSSGDLMAGAGAGPPTSGCV
eukprot:CAMPEP_0185173198 /NCGR_PEP_ID=MMETSP1139-20130426/22952_1 /TAXON_ID=298111 /ORGANISM="Pavlova sp., Strain CCMP459" /LENGTH=183 /DNA_ID=CAMNT_0027738879 /DNA_START=350 /DNA_END=902 /DNA_ORIENTATION=-